MVFPGVDGRWMRDGVQFVASGSAGRPFDGVATHGGYLRAVVHKLGMGPVTAVARLERLDYDARDSRLLPPLHLGRPDAGLA